MPERTWELLLALLTRPELCEALAVQQTALRALRLPEGDKRLFESLIHNSPDRARMVLRWASNSADYWTLEKWEKLVGDLEEEREGGQLATLSEEELRAHATLHALIPPQAEESHRYTRVLAWGLQERLPELAASVLLHLESEYRFWESCEVLRHKIGRRLRETKPFVAVALVDDREEFLKWIRELLDNPESDGALVAILLDRILTEIPRSSAGGELLILSKALPRCPAGYRLPMELLVRKLASELPTDRIEMAVRLMAILENRTLEEKRKLGELLRTVFCQSLMRAERRDFLRLLTHWLRPALTGPGDELQSGLQADRAIALLMHLSPRRLFAAKIWKDDLAEEHHYRFRKRHGQLRSAYLQRRSLMRELIATLEAIAAQKERHNG